MPDSNDLTARRFTLIMLSALTACVTLIVGFNLLIDPHGIFRILTIPGVNQVKPKGAQLGEAFKVQSISSLKPATLMLGNSRVEMGWNPQTLDPLVFGPVVNAALPGRDLQSMRGLATHAWHVSRPARLLVGVDFMDCLELENTNGPAPGVTPDRKTPGLFESERFKRLSERATDAFSVDTAFDSLVTLGSQRDPGSRDLRLDGFNPAREYEVFARIDGPHKMFAQRDAENARGRFAGARSIRYRDGSLSECFTHLQHLVADAHRREQPILIATYPYHARLLEMIRQSGLWNDFEDWKREIAALADRARSQGTRLSAFDFADYHDFAREVVPLSSGSGSGLQWYWESGHFKSALGDRMLAVMTGRMPAAGGFGVALDGATIDAALAASRLKRNGFVAADPKTVAEIARFLERGALRTRTAPAN